MSLTVDIPALRAQVCRIIAAYGESLDALTCVHEVQSGHDPINANERAANVAIICEHLAAALAPADQAAVFASDYADALTRLEEAFSAPPPHAPPPPRDSLVSLLTFWRSPAHALPPPRQSVFIIDTNEPEPLIGHYHAGTWMSSAGQILTAVYAWSPLPETTPSGGAS